MNLSPEDRAELEEAVRSLEKPAFVPKLIDIIGLPLDKAMAALPHNWKHVVQGATHKALVAALELAMLTMQSPRTKPASNFLHKLFVAASGAGGGALGLVSLPVELPFSTCLILRSVADIARSEGEEIRSAPAKLACLEVLALGGRTASDDGIQVGYFALRSVLAHEVSEAAKFIAQRGLVEGAPPIARLITTVAARFGTVVSEKAAAQSVPVIGAVGGALINTVFMDHFQNMARGHFTVRRLERSYGASEIEACYQEVQTRIARKK